MDSPSGVATAAHRLDMEGSTRNRNTLSSVKSNWKSPIPSGVLAAGACVSALESRSRNRSPNIIYSVWVPAQVNAPEAVCCLRRHFYHVSEYLTGSLGALPHTQPVAGGNRPTNAAVVRTFYTVNDLVGAIAAQFESNRLHAHIAETRATTQFIGISQPSSRPRFDPFTELDFSEEESAVVLAVMRSAPPERANPPRKVPTGDVAALLRRLGQ